MLAQSMEAIMSEYRIVGSYRNEDTLMGSSSSARTALNYYRAAVKPSGPPVSGIRIVDPTGLEIDSFELNRRARDEASA